MATSLDPDVSDFPEEYNMLSVSVLHWITRRKLAMYLDLKGTLITVKFDNIPTDIVNDISGLAKLAGQGSLNITSLRHQLKSPTRKFLDTWNDRNATIGKLLENLLIMQRHDAIKDCRQYILSDCQKFLDQKEKAMKAERNTEDTRGHARHPWEHVYRRDVVYGLPSPERTIRREPEYPYNAFVCYNQDDPEDVRFVQKLIQELEGGRGLRLFVPGRDDLPGASENINTAAQIERRCQRVIIVISRSFLQSSVWNFQERFAQALSPDARSERLIPIIREEGVVVPRALQVRNTFDFTNIDTFEATTDRLTPAITAPMGLETYLGLHSYTALQDISWPRDYDHTTPKEIITTSGNVSPQAHLGSSSLSSSGTGPNIQEEETVPKTLAILNQPHPVLVDTTSNSENSEPQECEGDMTSEVINNPYGPEALHSDPVQGSDEYSTMGDLEPEEDP